MNGVCALCNRSMKLKDSHFMPKAIYRTIKKGFPGQGEDIIWISGFDKSAAYTDKQAKKHLLCENCELKFSKNGEDIVLPLMARPNGFKLATKIRKYKALTSVQDEVWYFPPNGELAFGFMYFAVSIAWRMSATDWGSCGLPDTENSIRKEKMYAFSKFLMGDSALPENTYLAVYVENQVVDTPSMSFPTVKNHDGYQHIVFSIPGIKFSIVAGSNLGSGVVKTFSHSSTRVYFVSRSLKSHPDYHFMVNFLKHESKAKGRLLRERSQNV
ncbi:hypothetical protein ACU6TU_00715 [Halomonas sp. LS-001]